MYIFFTVTVTLSQRILQDNVVSHKYNYSCGDPLVEMIEKAARISLIVSKQCITITNNTLASSQHLHTF